MLYFLQNETIEVEIQNAEEIQHFLVGESDEDEVKDFLMKFHENIPMGMKKHRLLTITKQLLLQPRFG
jgi:hypothetical protein